MYVDGNPRQGLFTLQDSDGSYVYTQGPAFMIDGMNTIRSITGNLLVPNITIPSGADLTTLNIATDGTVTIVSNGNVQQLGQITLSAFQASPEKAQYDKGIYRATPASGPVMQDTPGSNGLGLIRFYAIQINSN
jgi:flagellar basal-body rod protein FlgG